MNWYEVLFFHGTWPLIVQIVTLSSFMSTTWAVISWSVPSYIPVDSPIITYEIGYTTHQSGSCSPSDEFNPMIKTNTSSGNVNISDLISNTCYLFGVRGGYTINGYGLWTIIANQTLDETGKLFSYC